MDLSDETITTVRQARLDLRNGLVLAGRHLRKARTLAALDRGLHLGCRMFLLLAVGYLVWRLLVLVTGLTDPVFGGWTFFFLALGHSLLPIQMQVFRAGGKMESLSDTAERLDLSSNTGNHIATALSLSSRSRIGPFEAAAIVDGLEAVNRAQIYIPILPQRRLPGFKEVGWVYLALLILAVAGFLPTGSETLEADGQGESEQRDLVARAPDLPPGMGELPRGESFRSRRDASEVASPENPRTESGQGRSRSTPPSRGKRVKAAGHPGKGRSGEAREARQSSVSRGDPTEGNAPLHEARKKKPGGKKKKKSKKPTRARIVGSRKKKEGQETGATVGQGGAGGGAMSPIKSPWAQRDRSGEEPLPENPADEDVEDEIDEEEARGGTQPSMRDRKAATSRDLSISGPGEGGEGRGGPTPQKKARGTASLVLGVPVPDFVRGLLNPGTTKVTHERIEPVTSPGKTHPPAAATGRIGLEPRVTPDRTPIHLRSTVRRFLLSLHNLGRLSSS